MRGRWEPGPDHEHLVAAVPGKSLSAQPIQAGAHQGPELFGMAEHDAALEAGSAEST